MIRKDNGADSTIVTSAEISKILGFKSTERIRQLDKDGFLVRVSHGKFDLAKSIQLYIKKNIEKIEEKYSGEEKLNAIQEDAKLKKVRRESAELDLAMKKGELYQTQTIENLFAETFLVVRRNLLNLPERLAQELSAINDQHEIRERIRSALNKVLTDVSCWNPEGAEVDD